MKNINIDSCTQLQEQMELEKKLYINERCPGKSILQRFLINLHENDLKNQIDDRVQRAYIEAMGELVYNLLTGECEELPPGDYKAKVESVTVKPDGSVHMIIKGLEQMKEEMSKRSIDASAPIVLHSGLVVHPIARDIINSYDTVVIDEMHHIDSIMPDCFDRPRYAPHGFNCDANLDDLANNTRHVKPFYRKGRW